MLQRLMLNFTDMFRVHSIKGQIFFSNTSRGRQCVANALVSCVVRHVSSKPLVDWTGEDIDNILLKGDVLYQHTRRFYDSVYLESCELPSYICFEGQKVRCTVTATYSGDIGMYFKDCGNFCSLESALSLCLGGISHKGIIVCSNSAVAVHYCEPYFHVFDSHSRDADGKTSDEDHDQETHIKTGLNHLNVVLLHIIEKGFIYDPFADKQKLPSDLNSPLFKGFLVGPKVEKLSAAFVFVGSYYKSLSQKDRHIVGAPPADSREVRAFARPKDSRVVLGRKDSVTFGNDLIPLFTDYDSGFMKLTPVSERRWAGMLQEDCDGKLCLQHISIKHNSKISAGKLFVQFACDWPDQASDFITRDRTHKWPSPNLIQRVVDDAGSVGPRHLKPTHTHGNSDIHWEFSFYLGMKIIALEAVTQGQRRVFRPFRLFIESLLQHVEGCINTVLLKIAFFYACESIADKDWKSEPVTCILYMLEHILEWLRKRHFPDYFIKDRNMIEEMTTECIEKHVDLLDMLRRRTLVCVYFILDQHRLTETSIGPLIDCVIGDIKREWRVEFLTDDADAKPELKHTVQRCIMTLDFGPGLQLCLIYYEKALDSGNTGEVPSFSQFLISVLNDITLVYKLCFAFYVDRQTGTTILDTLLEGWETVLACDFIGTDMMQVFGLPNHVLRIPNVITEDPLSLLSFVDVFSDVLFFCFEFGDTMVQVLHHFISHHGRMVLAVEEPTQDVGRRGSKMPITPLLQWTTTTEALCHFYTKLFTVCGSRNEMYLLADLMDIFEDICEKMADAKKYMLLASYWGHVGNKQRKQLAISKARALSG